MPLIQRKQRLFYACFLWSLLLTALAMQPEKLVETFLPFSIMRSLAHSAAYGAFAFLLCLYFSFRRHLFGIPMKGFAMHAAAFLLTAALGGFTELIQLFSPDRYAELVDWYFDLAGALGGILVFTFSRRWGIL
jgi:VanZ family protein